MSGIYLESGACVWSTNNTERCAGDIGASFGIHSRDTWTRGVSFYTPKTFHHVRVRRSFYISVGMKCLLNFNFTDVGLNALLRLRIVLMALIAQFEIIFLFLSLCQHLRPCLCYSLPEVFMCQLIPNCAPPVYSEASALPCGS